VPLIVCQAHPVRDWPGCHVGFLVFRRHHPRDIAVINALLPQHFFKEGGQLVGHGRLAEFRGRGQIGRAQPPAAASYTVSVAVLATS
jgi:hypothetical protein